MKTCLNCNNELNSDEVTCTICGVATTPEEIKQIVSGAIVVDRYEIGREIDRGGMGIVYLAYDRVMEKEVALRAIPKELSLEPRAFPDLKREVGLALSLNHQHIVRLYNLDMWEGQIFVTMEYVAGGTLAHYLAERGHLSLAEAQPLLKQIASAIDYSHSANPAVIHLDLKPLNILFASTGEVKVGNFGLSRVLRDTACRVYAHDSEGTLSYLAPEQVRGKKIGRLADIYAFSAITYELLCGHPPFYTGDLRWQILHEEVEPIEGMAEHVNRALACCLDKEANRRPATAAEFLAMLLGEGLERETKSARKSEDEKQTIKTSSTEQSKKAHDPTKRASSSFRSPSSKLIYAIAGVFLLVALAAGAFYFRGNMQKALNNFPVSITSDPAGATTASDRGKKTAEKPSPTYKDPTTGMEFVYILGGCFQMGSLEGEKDRKPEEGPVHEVCVDGFYLGKHEVTNEQYRIFKPLHDSKSYQEQSLNGNSQPVVRVTWNESYAFASWLSKKSGKTYRLPTEAEWEYAARGGKTTARFWGETTDEACGYANIHDFSSKQTNTNIQWEPSNCDDGYAVSSPVGIFKPNAFGLHDMLGNVFEWCNDWYDARYYSVSPRQNPKGTASGERRVVRGGGWYSAERMARSANRFRNLPDHSDFNIGIRLVLQVNATIAASETDGKNIEMEPDVPSQAVATLQLQQSPKRPKHEALQPDEQKVIASIDGKRLRNPIDR